MPRKVEKIISLEVVEPNSMWDYRETKGLTNFICKKDEAERVLQDMDRRDYWRHKKNYVDEVKGILAPAGTRNSSVVFFADDVNVEEIKLPSNIKDSTKYIYKVYDYVGEKLNTEYGTQKEALACISKKIKTKYAYVTYNGETRKIECTPKAITDILNELEKTTSQFEIESVSRSGDTSDAVLITIFKNCIKI